MAETMQSPSPNSELPSASVLRTYTCGTDLSGTMQGAGGVGGLLGVSVQRHSCSFSYAACSDANGNIVGLIGSSTGNLAARRDYDAFGHQLTDWEGEGISTTEPCPFRFSSKYRDAETGWYYYGFEYCAPEMGRWVNKDPIEEAGGINLYEFCDNDAIEQMSLLGLKAIHLAFRDDGMVGACKNLPSGRVDGLKEMLARCAAMTEGWKTIDVVVRELGHLAGWIKKGTLHEETDLTNLMSWYTSEPKPDCVWRRRILSVAR